MTMMAHPVDTACFGLARLLQPRPLITEVKIQTIVEAEPNRDSRVTLSETEGQPRAESREGGLAGDGAGQAHLRSHRRAARRRTAARRRGRRHARRAARRQAVARATRRHVASHGHDAHARFAEAGRRRPELQDAWHQQLLCRRQFGVSDRGRELPDHHDRRDDAASVRAHRVCAEKRAGRERDRDADQRRRTSGDGSPQQEEPLPFAASTLHMPTISRSRWARSSALRDASATHEETRRGGSFFECGSSQSEAVRGRFANVPFSMTAHLAASTRTRSRDIASTVKRFVNVASACARIVAASAGSSVSQRAQHAGGAVDGIRSHDARAVRLDLAPDVDLVGDQHRQRAAERLGHRDRRSSPDATAARTHRSHGRRPTSGRRCSMPVQRDAIRDAQLARERLQLRAPIRRRRGRPSRDARRDRDRARRRTPRSAGRSLSSHGCGRERGSGACPRAADTAARNARAARAASVGGGLRAERDDFLVRAIEPERLPREHALFLAVKSTRSASRSTRYSAHGQ